MFNLEQTIAKWRRRAAREGLAPDVIDELESHLRDEVARQVSDGTDVESAFRKAVQLLGDASELNDEFAKVNPVKPGNSARRQQWAMRISFGGAAAIVLINTWTLADFELSAFERMVGALAIAATGLLVACAPFLRTWLPIAADAQLARAIKIAANIAALLPIILTLSAMHLIQLESRPLATLLVWLILAGVTFSTIAIGLSDGPDVEAGNASEWPLHPQVPSRMTRKLAVDSMELLEVAREEAARMGHAFIGTEHVLLGVLKVAKGSIANFLTGSKIYSESVRQEIEHLIGAQESELSSAEIPLTPRARKALQIAGKEAARFHPPLVTAEHILLGLVLEGSGLGAMILKKTGIRAEPIRQLIASGRRRFSID